MRSLRSRKHFFSQRVEAMSLGISHVFLVAMVSPLMLLAMRIIESTVHTYTGMTFSDIFSGEVGAQVFVALCIVIISIIVATYAMKSIFFERIYGQISKNFSVMGMTVMSWLLAVLVSTGGAARYGQFSREVLMTVFVILPFIHFFVLKFVLGRLAK